MQSTQPPPHDACVKPGPICGVAGALLTSSKHTCVMFQSLAFQSLAVAASLQRRSMPPGIDLSVISWETSSDAQCLIIGSACECQG